MIDKSKRKTELKIREEMHFKMLELELEAANFHSGSTVRYPACTIFAKGLIADSFNYVTIDWSLIGLCDASRYQLTNQHWLVSIDRWALRWSIFIGLITDHWHFSNRLCVENTQFQKPSGNAGTTLLLPKGGEAIFTFLVVVTCYHHYSVLK